MSSVGIKLFSPIVSLTAFTANYSALSIVILVLLLDLIILKAYLNSA